MRWFALVRNTLTSLRHRHQREADLESEFRDHWNQEVEYNRSSGMSPDEAENAARRLIGSASLYQEACRDAWGTRLVEDIVRDIHYALRSMRKNSAFSMIAIVALALGIGASTAIYTLAQTVVFAPLPFPNASRLVRVTYDLFTILGVQPAMGRNFRTEEDQPGRGQEIILSDNLWRTRFGSDRHILGKTIRLAGQRETDEYVVVGVMPAGFNFPLTIPNSVNPPTRQMAYWIPFATQPSRTALTSLNPVGLLRPGVSLREAQADHSSIAAQLEREFPDTNLGSRVRLIPLKDEILGQSKVALTLLLAAISAILAIICANLAHLLLSRVFSRTRESGVRLALGASRSRLVQQWLIESLMLASMGGSGAVLIAKGTLWILLRFAPQGIPRITETHLDLQALTFLILATLFTGLIVGQLPAFAAARTDVRTALSSAGIRTTTHQGSVRIRDLLIVAEVSVTVVLALGAGLLLKSFSRLASVDPGFSRDHVTMALILLVDRKYSDLDSRTAFANKLLRELKKEAGILSAGMVDATPLSGNIANLAVGIDGRPSSERGANRPTAEVFSVSSDYLTTAGIHLQRGRYLKNDDARHPVALINQSAANAFWPHQNALGKLISFETGAKQIPARAIVGIVSDTRDDNIDKPARPAIYVSMDGGIAPPQMLLARVRDDVSDSTAAQMIRHAVVTLDKNQPVFLVTSMEDLYNNSIAERRFTTFLLTSLGALALALAALGVYGGISYSATQRTREIGIRAALGAQGGQIVWLVLQRGLFLSLAGTAVGIISGLLLTRYLSALLYEVTPTDFSTLLMVVFLITGMSLLAGWVPSYRAMRIDPMRALRQE